MSDSKDEAALKQGRELVAELFKLLDAWDREERQRKASAEIGARAVGVSSVESKGRN